MNLCEATEAASELTRALFEALAGEDLAQCETLLVRRAEAMVVFEDRHRAADDEERLAAKDLILELLARDHKLQEKAAEVFALAEQASRARLGAQPPNLGAYALSGKD